MRNCEVPGYGTRRRLLDRPQGGRHVQPHGHPLARARADMTTASALVHSDVATRLPAQDLERARTWYSEKLGLDPVEERPGGLRYKCGATYFVVFQSTGRATGDHTQMAWDVGDIEATMAELRARGVEFVE